MHYFRTSRHTSAIVTAALLVALGVVIGLTRHDPGDHPGVELRADKQALQPSPTVTVPSAVIGRTATTTSADHPPLTIGRLGGPIHAPAAGNGGQTGGGGTTATTAGSPGSTTNTTIGTVGGDAAAFAPGRITYSSGGATWTINPDGSSAHSVVSPGYFPAWSPDHSAIAYANADSPGGALSVITASGTTALTTGVVADGEPAWSPDGTKIAFARIDNTQSSQYSEIWIVNRDGSNLRQLTHLACFNRDPSWSPDGKKLVFWSSSDHCDPGPTQGDLELYVADVGTAKVTRLGTKANSKAPAWSPDGKTIAFASDGYDGVGFEICLMNADGTNAHRITNYSGDDTDPAWSPDGKSIVFRSDRNGGGVFTMKADGSDVKLLVAGASEPNWF